jgi:hypothetical protein
MEPKWVISEVKSASPQKNSIPLVLSVILLFCAGLGLAALLLTFNTPAAASFLRVTPLDTSPDTLDVTVTILEEQDATDDMSNITVSFSTIVIKEKNYVRFDQPNAAVICNGVKQSLGEPMQYTLRVPRKSYACAYSGTRDDGEALPYTQLFAIPLRSELSPRPPTITSNGFSLHYTPDADSLCHIQGKAIDSANDPAVVGELSTSDQSVYSGPSTSSLQGGGDILLTRTCNWPNLPSAYHHLSLTYISQASIEVTWTH